MTFVFYDTETTGLDSAFDQILQFAAIVTDDAFNTLEELNGHYPHRPDRARSGVSNDRAFAEGQYRSNNWAKLISSKSWPVQAGKFDLEQPS